jgi:hypothetical protein
MREKLAEYAHAAWSGWMKYLFEKSTVNADGTVTIPAWAVSRWQRQMNTPYEALPANEKESDGVEADRMIAIMSSHLTPDAADFLWTCPECEFSNLEIDDVCQLCTTKRASR